MHWIELLDRRFNCSSSDLSRQTATDLKQAFYRFTILLMLQGELSGLGKVAPTLFISYLFP